MLGWGGVGLIRSIPNSLPCGCRALAGVRWWVKGGNPRTPLATGHPRAAANGQLRTGTDQGNPTV